MKKSAWIIGGVVAAAATGAYFYFKNKKAQAAAAAASQAANQAAYNQMQSSVLAYLNTTIAGTPQTNTAPAGGGMAPLTANQIAQLLAAQNAAPNTENASAGTIEPVGSTAAQRVGGSNIEYSQLQKLIQAVSQNLLSFDELNAVNNEILQEQGNYVGTLSTGDIQSAYNAVLKKYHIK